ncbi:MAG: radical SAM protein [Thermoguttaceae bacterium]
MSYMELILSSDCNLRCAYCFEKDKQPLDMPDEVALRAVDFLIEVSGNLKGVGILLFGGEPMLRFDLIQKVHAYATEKAKAAGKSIDWSMTTNGTLVDAERAEWLARRGVRYLLSMDGGRQDHDRYRHFPDGRGTFDLLINRLPMMKRFQAWMGVKMSVVPQSLATLRDGIEELHRAGINQFLVGYAHGVPWSDDDVRRYESALQEVCELCLEMEYHKRHFRIATYEEKSLRDRLDEQAFGCGAGRGRFCVDPCGDLYGCSKLATILGSGKGVLPMGNVFQGFTAVQNRMALLVTDAGPRRKCAGCELKRACAGGCPAVNAAEGLDIFACDDLSCKLSFVTLRVDDYIRRRHDRVFGSDWCKRPAGDKCAAGGGVSVPA